MSTNGHLKFQGTNRATFVGETSNIMFDTTTTSLGIGVTGTDHPSSNLYITGNAYVSSNIAVGGVLTMGTVNVVARHDLESVTATGNTTPLTVEFQNADTSLVTTGNVQVGKELTVTGNTTVSSNLTVSGNVSDLNIVSNVNMLHTANTASIKLNSNVVTEFPRSKKLIKYPRVAMTNSTSGGYEVDASTEFSANYVWKAFDQDSNTYWHGDHGSTLWNSSGDYIGGVELITGHEGDWITLKLPTNGRISPRGIRLFPRGLRTTYSAGQAPKDVVVIGSNSGSSWDVIATTTLTNYSFGTDPSTSTPDGEEYVPATFDFETIEYYQYVGIIIKTIYTGSHANPSISQLEFLGLPEYDPEADGVDVVVKSVPNVPNTDWLEVYYDAKNYSGSGDVQDETGNNRNGTLDGVTYDSVSESFEFVGGNKITAGPMTSFPSGTNYTASMWFKVSEIVASQKLLFHFGHGDTGESFGLNIQDGNIGQFLWGGTSKYTVDNLYTANEWVHAVGTINGSTAEVYVNGHLRLSWAQDITVTIPTNPYLSLGIHFNGEQSSFFTGSNFFTGSIANFRLFNRALTSDEIYQLYAYQKEYFGHGDLSMTLKAGRLGIGTSEPRAMLDVRGDIFGPGIIQVQSTTFNGTASGTGTSFTTLSGLTTSITPKRTDSKILILLNLFWSGSDDAYFQGNIKKDGTVLVKQEGSVGSASKTTFGAFGSYNRGIYALKNVGFSYLDDTNIGTERIEYTVEVRNRALAATNYNDWWINYTSSTNDANRLTAVSTLTLIEIQQ